MFSITPKYFTHSPSSRRIWLSNQVLVYNYIPVKKYLQDYYKNTSNPNFKRQLVSDLKYIKKIYSRGPKRKYNTIH